eukprot:5112237-Amphidinium_carterae.2
MACFHKPSDKATISRIELGWRRLCVQIPQDSCRFTTSVHLYYVRTQHGGLGATGQQHAEESAYKASVPLVNLVVPCGG